MPLPLAMHVRSGLLGLVLVPLRPHLGSFLGHILGSKTAPDRNSIGFREIVALEAPLGLDLVGFWVPLGVPFLGLVGQILV